MSRSRELAPALLVTLLGACSFEDFSYLQQGERGSNNAGGNGVSTSGGTSNKVSSVSGGTNFAGGSTNGGNSNVGGATGGGSTLPSSGGTNFAGGSTNGGNSNVGGMTSSGATVSSSAGGVGGLVGTGSGGVATGGGATGGAGTATPNPLGPWNFDTASEVAADWHQVRVGVTVDWVSQGQATPLGAMRIDATAKSSGEAQHELPSTRDATGCTFSAEVRAASGAGTVQLYAIDTKFYRGNEALVAVDDTAWKALTFALASPASTSGAFNAAAATSIGVAMNGSILVWVDQARFVCGGTGDAGNDAGDDAG